MGHSKLRVFAHACAVSAQLWMIEIWTADADDKPRVLGHG